MSVSAWISGCSALISVASLGITVWLNWWRKGLEDQKEFLSSAFDCLEVSFELLQPEKAGLPPPKKRINWLNAARNIEYFKSFKSKIKDPSLLLLWETKQERWRSEFHKRLSHGQLNTPEYFNGRNDDKIDIRSAYIVITFSYWNPAIEDPISGYSELDLRNVYEELNHIPAMGLKFHVENEIERREKRMRERDSSAGSDNDR